VATTDDRIRLEIAFDGQQVLSVYVAPKAADALDGALAGGEDGSYTFDADDGRYTLALRRIVYVKRFARESRVGFGTGS
jgi:hypothetical protein